MIVGILKVELYIPESGSLKSKRMVIRSFKDRIRSKFNVSVAEADNHEKWQRATFWIATVGSDKKHVNAQLSAVLNLARGMNGVEIIDHEVELL